MISSFSTRGLCSRSYKSVMLLYETITQNTDILDNTDTKIGSGAFQREASALKAASLSSHTWQRKLSLRTWEAKKYFSEKLRNGKSLQKALSKSWHCQNGLHKKCPETGENKYCLETGKIKSVW